MLIAIKIDKIRRDRLRHTHTFRKKERKKERK